MPSLDQFVIWIVVGLLGGSLAGLMIKWDRNGFGLVRNLGVASSALSSAVCCSAGLGFPRSRQVRDLAARCRCRHRRITCFGHDKQHTPQLYRLL